MKPFTDIVSMNPRPLADPVKPISMLLFCMLAFKPVMVHFAWTNVPETNLFAVTGPLVAGLWLASTICATRFQIVLLGTIVGALLIAANWIIGAEGCCATLRS